MLARASHARISVRLRVPPCLTLAATSRTCHQRRQSPSRSATSNGVVHTGLVESSSRHGCTRARAPASNCPDWSLPRAAACPRTAMRPGRDNEEQWGPWRAHGQAARLKLRRVFLKRRPLHEGRARRGHMADRHLARGGLIVDDVDATFAGDGNHAVLVSKVKPPREAHGAAR